MKLFFVCVLVAFVNALDTITLVDGLSTTRVFRSYPHMTCRGYACSQYRMPIMNCTNTTVPGSKKTTWSCDHPVHRDLYVDNDKSKIECGYDDNGEAIRNSCRIEYVLVGAIWPKWLAVCTNIALVALGIAIVIFVIYPIVRALNDPPPLSYIAKTKTY